MKHRLRFRLRTAIIAITAVGVTFGCAANYYSNKLSQRDNVQTLVELGGEFHARQGSFNKIQVWYDGDLEWNETEQRFEITLASSLGERTGVSRWIHDNLGLDFLESPIALEIDCHDFGGSTLDPKIIEQIKTLPTVRQVWLAEWTDGNGNPTNETTNEDLKNLFPELIVASPQ